MFNWWCIKLWSIHLYLLPPHLQLEWKIWYWISTCIHFIGSTDGGVIPVGGDIRFRYFLTCSCLSGAMQLPENWCWRGKRGGLDDVATKQPKLFWKHSWTKILATHLFVVEASLCSHRHVRTFIAFRFILWITFVIVEWTVESLSFE